MRYGSRAKAFSPRVIGNACSISFVGVLARSTARHFGHSGIVGRLCRIGCLVGMYDSDGAAIGINPQRGLSQFARLGPNRLRLPSGNRANDGVVPCPFPLALSLVPSPLSLDAVERRSNSAHGATYAVLTTV